MSWARLDDRFWSNPKVRRAWKLSRAAIGLHVMAMTYCAMHELDGKVGVEVIEDLLPQARERKGAVDALLSAGLWEPGGTDEFVIHDYLEYNPSRADLDAKRVKDAERKARGRQTQSEQRPRGHDADSARSPDGVGAESSGPDPTRPDTPLEVESPATASDEARPSGNGSISISEGDVGLADEILGTLQRAVEGLTTDERGRPPSREAILKVLRHRQPATEVALRIAADARGTVQSQNRAPNIVGLFEQKLVEAMGAAA